MGLQARAGDADAVAAQPQPQPQLALSPHLVGAWSAGVIDPRSWGFGAHEYVVRTRASRLRTLRRIIAGLPDAVSSMRPAIWPAEYGDEHSGIRRLESRWAGIIASSSSPRQVPRVLLASEEHQTHPLTLRGCIALSLVQLLFETDAHRSSASRAYARDSACVPPYAAMRPTLLL